MKNLVEEFMKEDDLVKGIELLDRFMKIVPETGPKVKGLYRKFIELQEKLVNEMGKEALKNMEA